MPDDEIILTTSQFLQVEKLSLLGAMLAGITHEINNPLNFVSMAKDNLKDELSDLDSTLKVLTEDPEAYEMRLQFEKKFESLYKLISDIGSGINFKRQGLNAILDSCMQNNIGEVVIANKDRLSRFGFDLIKLIIEKAGGKITIINDEQNKSTEQELAEDLLSIINIYYCRQMEKRQYTKHKS